MNEYFGPLDGASTGASDRASAGASSPTRPRLLPLDTGALPAAPRWYGPGGVPAPGSVPPFAPLRVTGGRFGAGRPARAWPRVAAAVLTAAAVTALAPGPTAPASPTASPASHARPGGVPPQAGPPRVRAPVRLADPAVAGMLRAGDLVDVIAAGPQGRPRVLAREARIALTPASGGVDTAGGALVVLSVPRPTAVRLLGTAPEDRLAVALRDGP